MPRPFMAVLVFTPTRGGSPDPPRKPGNEPDKKVAGRETRHPECRIVLFLSLPARLQVPARRDGTPLTALPKQEKEPGRGEFACHFKTFSFPC